MYAILSIFSQYYNELRKKITQFPYITDFITNRKCREFPLLIPCSSSLIVSYFHLRNARRIPETGVVKL
jgi:hypothetical protein